MNVKTHTDRAFYRQPLTADECPDAEGWYSIRISDGSPNGDTNTLVATVYSQGHAPILAAAPEMRELLATTQPGGLSPAAFTQWSAAVHALLARIDGVEP